MNAENRRFSMDVASRGGRDIQSPWWRTQSQHHAPPNAALDWRVPVLVWLASLLLLIPTASTVFGFDSAAFSYVARELQSGSVLYRDLWDNKQPGIYWFYQLVTQLLGSNWHALLIATSVWTASTALLASCVIMHALPNERWAWPAPLLVVAVLAERAEPEHIGQIETLVALPLFGICLCAQRLSAHCAASAKVSINATLQGCATHALLGLAAGLLGGAVMTFKVVLTPLAAIVFFAALAPSVVRQQWRWRQLCAATAGFSVGVLAIAGVVVSYFIDHGVFDTFWWTTFRYPTQALAHAPLAPPERLFVGLRWFAISAAPLVPLTVLAMAKGQHVFKGAAGGAVLFAMAWLSAGFALILVQKFSWWSYHFEMLLWPLGILAATGIARLREPRDVARTRTMELWLPWLVVASTALLLAEHGAHGIKKRSAPDWPLGTELRSAIDRAQSLTTAFDAQLPSAACGTGYVIGDPRLLLASGMRQAIATPGMSWWGAFLPSQLALLPAQLAQAQPDYVYLDSTYQTQFARELPELGHWLERVYLPLMADTTGGVWWQRAASNGASGCPTRPVFVVP